MTDPNEPPAPPAPPGPARKLAIQIDPPTAQGTYANFAMITHGEGEFILDFLFLQPGRDEGRVNARVIVNPVNAKRLLAALGENVHAFEQRFGTIPMTGKVPSDDGTVH